MKKERIKNGKDMELVFCGLEGLRGDVIDVTASFVSAEGTTFTIKLDDEQFKKLKNVRSGTVVKVTML